MRGWSSQSWQLFPFLSKNLPGTEEQIKREASEREKDPSERKVEELQRQLENQKGVLERLRARVRNQMREREKTAAGTGESSAHSGVGGSCSALWDCYRRSFPKWGPSSPSLNTLYALSESSKVSWYRSNQAARAFPSTLPKLPLMCGHKWLEMFYVSTCFYILVKKSGLGAGECRSQIWLLFSSSSKSFLEQKSGPEERQLKGKRNLLNKRLKNYSQRWRATEVSPWRELDSKRQRRWEKEKTFWEGWTRGLRCWR